MKIEDLKGKFFMDNYMDIAIEEYLKFKETVDYDEKYKREVLSEINDYLKDKRIAGENVIEIIKYFQSKNPQKGGFVHWSNLDDLYKYAEEKPSEVAELFNYLYDDSADLEDRIRRFVNTGERYNTTIKFDTSLFGYLLAGFSLEKYPLYRDQAFREFLNSFGINESLTEDVADKYSTYYEVCNILLDYFKEKNYIKNPDMLDAQDFIYCLTNYKELYVKVSVKYLYEHSKVLDSFNKNNQLFVDYINSLNKSYIEYLLEKYKKHTKEDLINAIRAKICKEILEKGTITLHEIESIKKEFSEKEGMRSWGNLFILIPFYYEKYKEKVNIDLKRILEAIRSIEAFKGYEFKEYIYGFVMTHFCWGCLYPKEKKSHTDNAVQLTVSISHGDNDYFPRGISYGLDFTGEWKKKVKEIRDLETVLNPDEFSYKKMEKKFIEVFDRFKDIIKVSHGEKDKSGEEEKDDFLHEVDFEREIQINNLFFEDGEVLSKQISNALKSGKHIILVGPPGTGKSKLAREICRSYEVDYEMATAMSDWSTYDTIGGYKPDVDGTLYFDEGVFLRLFKNKKNNDPTIKWLIIDEINRADIDKAFGALFSALTGDKVILSFKSKSGENIVLRPQEEEEKIEQKEHEYIIPKDFRIIGTMNTYDKTSLYEMSYAFMRRFAFIPVGVPKNIDKDLVAKYLNIWGIEDKSINNVDLKEGLAEVWNIINKYRRVGPAIIEDIARYVSVEGDYTSAVILYVLPQFEGVMENDIKKFAEELYKSSIGDFSRQKDRLDGFIKDFFGIKM